MVRSLHQPVKDGWGECQHMQLRISLQPKPSQTTTGAGLPFFLIKIHVYTTLFLVENLLKGKVLCIFILKKIIKDGLRKSTATRPFT